MILPDEPKAQDVPKIIQVNGIISDYLYSARKCLNFGN
jgi:hypothetical protein